jgi:hypothetical protein
VRGSLKRMGSNDCSRGQSLAVQGRDGRELQDTWQNLSEVKNAAEKTGLLPVVFMRTGRLEMQVLGRGSR